MAVGMEMRRRTGMSPYNRSLTVLVTFFLLSHLLCLLQVTVFGLMAKSSTGAAFVLAKKSAVSSLVTTSTTLATTFGISEATLEKWLGGGSLTNDIHHASLPIAIIEQILP
jgi:hypothetical protein